jgi:hypothetical protein
MFEGFALERIDVGEAPDQLAAVLADFFSGSASDEGSAAGRSAA